MKSNTSLMGTAFLLSLVITSLAVAQSSKRTMDGPFAPGLVADAPFAATWQSIVLDHGKPISQTKVRMARASNGSTYVATLLPDGTPSQIEIDDVPNNRMITVNALDRTYSLSTPQGGQFHILSVQQVTELLQKEQDLNDHGVEHPPLLRVTSLGVRQESGMTLYGRKEEWNVGDKAIQESWISSDLCVKASTKQTSLSPLSYDGTIRDIRREEPDSKLFKIPEGYNPI
jgi:hypothetical protein